MPALITRFAADETGVTAIEYGLISAFMAVCLVGGLPYITNALDPMMDRLGRWIAAGVPCPW